MILYIIYIHFFFQSISYISITWANAAIEINLAKWGAGRGGRCVAVLWWWWSVREPTHHENHTKLNTHTKIQVKLGKYELSHELYQGVKTKRLEDST